MKHPLNIKNKYSLMKKAGLISLFLLLTSATFTFGYYPGWPNRNLSVMQTAEITENKHLFTRVKHRFEEPVFVKNESNVFYQFFGFDEGANIYLDVAAGFANLAELKISRERNDKIYGFEGKVHIFNQNVDKKWLSISMTANSQIKTHRIVADSKRYSFGSSLILTRALFNDKVELLYNGFLQTHTNPTDIGPSGSIANGLGLIVRIDRTALFTEWILPVDADVLDFGYLRSGGQPLQSYGLIYSIYFHSFSLLFSNYSDINSVNFLTGARDEDWINSMRVGFNITRTFKLMH